MIRPLLDHPERFELGLFFEKMILPLARLLQTALAKVVAAALAEHGSEFVRIDGLDQRDVFLDELFLERDRVSRDDDALLVPHRKIDRWNQVRERFPHAGARFYEQMMAFVERLLDGRRHFQLLRAELI